MRPGVRIASAPSCVGLVVVLPSISLAWNRLIRPLTTKVTLCWM